MANDRELFVRQRRGLNTVSIGILVFFLADGELENRVTFSLGGFVLHDVVMVKILAWLALGYFLYRFYITGASAKQDYEVDRSLALFTTTAYRHSKFLPEGSSSHADTYVEKLPFRRYANPGQKLSNPPDIPELPAHRKYLGRDRHFRDDWIKVPYRKMFWPELVADIKALSRPGFSESVLPPSLATTAIGFGIFNLIL